MDRRWLATMLGDKKVEALVLKYLKTIDRGGKKREGVKKRELEWKQKNNQASEDLFE